MFPYHATGGYEASRRILKGLNAKSVLDIPCGWGRNTAWLSDDKDYLGVDIDENAIKQLQLRFPFAKTLVADVTTWTPDEPFDLAFIQCFFYTKIAGLDSASSFPFQNLRKWADTILIFDTGPNTWRKKMKANDWMILRQEGPFEEGDSWVELWV